MDRASLFYLGSTLSSTNGASHTDLISRSSLQDTPLSWFTGASRKQNNKVKMYVQLVINIKLNYLRMYYYYKRFKNV